MKKHILLAGILLISALTVAQKKEIKKAEKALNNGDLTEAIGLLNEAERLISNADIKLKTQFYVVKGEVYLADAGKNNFEKMKTAAMAFAKADELGESSYKERVSIGKQNLRVALVNSAISDQNSKNYSLASEKLHTSYMASKKDTSDLYYAAGNAVNAKDLPMALKFYKQLLDLGYTGIQKEYTALDNSSGKVVSFGDENERNTALLTGNYTNPNERMRPSVK